MKQLKVEKFGQCYNQYNTSPEFRYCYIHNDTICCKFFYYIRWWLFCKTSIPVINILQFNPKIIGTYCLRFAQFHYKYFISALTIVFILPGQYTGKQKETLNGLFSFTTICTINGYLQVNITFLKWYFLLQFPFPYLLLCLLWQYQDKAKPPQI